MNQVQVLDVGGFSPEIMEVIRTQICKGGTDADMHVFLHACNRTKLDPTMRQIYAVFRWNGALKKNVMTIQTGIDGFRLVADRTGKYSPGKAPTYTYDDKGQLESATATVRKMTADGTWHDVEATAFYDEYVQLDSNGKPTRFWDKMRKNQLAKCFDEETEVLTEFGFKKFSEVNGKIMQVTENGLEAVDVKPFSQDYDGEMISFEGTHLDFCVTPNHDMITTSGKIEAGIMYDCAKARPSFFIPRIVPENCGEGIGFTQEQCELAAACLCDGDYMSSKSFRIKVSRPHKIEKIISWNLHKKETLRQVAGKTTTHSSGRTITTRNDQYEFSFDADKIFPLVEGYKRLNHAIMLKMNSQEARWFIDAWVFFDGNGNSGGGTDRTRRIWSSDLQYLCWIEFLAIKAGYAISQRQARFSDIASKENYCLSLSEINEISVSRWGDDVSKFTRPHLSLRKTKNKTNKVWCVTVPSGVIVVRRNSFSMICGNCAEALALRKAFPADLSGLYIKEEMEQADCEILQPVSNKEEIKPLEEPKQIAKPQIISEAQALELMKVLADCDIKYQMDVYGSLRKSRGIEDIRNLPVDLYPRLLTAATKNKEKQKAIKEEVESCQI